MNKKIISYLSGFIFIATFVKAQDYHVSQYDVATLYLNAGTTGMYGHETGDYKVYLDQRSQWRSIGIKPFLTSYIAYDKPHTIRNRNVGFGAFIINNNGGLGNYNTFTFMGSAAYDILGKADTKSTQKHILSVGIQMGLFYRSTNPDKLNYDVQYSLANNGGAFDQSISSNEIYNRVNITRFDANYGLYYKYIERGEKVHPYAGFSMSHLTKPNESLVGGKTQMPIKFIGYGGCEIKIDDKMDIIPRIFYANQAKANEFTGGLLFYYRINENNVKIMAGFDYRLKDAYNISLGLKHPSYALRFSYDINASYLKNYTNGRGALEVSLIYVGEKGKSFFKSVSQF
ncbi:MAG: PorP/SprF family type IX secretion system membrane protein [Bacteroidota bacterium]|nr:PorP/SprF family type IX secretion system membrane protein [Bacteroidota bacterium]